MARRHGKNGEVMMDPAGSTTNVAVASLNSWTLDAASDNVDVKACPITRATSAAGGTRPAW